MNCTVRELPLAGLTLVAAKFADGPPLTVAGARYTVVCAASMAAAGKPVPEIETTAPACPPAGTVCAASVTTLLGGGGAWVTVNPLASCAWTLPVWTVTVRAPNAAPGSICKVAVMVVVLETSTGPAAPNAAPPTPIPGPKDATVAPCTNPVPCPVTAALTVCPAGAEEGVTDTTLGSGSMVNAAGAAL